ncbi:MAG: retron St85 family effector protein [Pseudomonadota bacterium]|nr:retron St85 family effector protein [Pseudomonadota bacterium]
MTSVHVYNPTKVVFVCGAEYDVRSIKPTSLRDQFMRFDAEGKLPQRRYILAEELNAFFPRGSYQDILTLETDLAQIYHLIIIFSESYGSVAELGAFSAIDEIAKRTLVFIDDKNYNKDSFISLGPIRRLENQYGDTSVCVLNCGQVGIKHIKSIESLNSSEFLRIVNTAITQREKTINDRSTFNPILSGHIIKLATGILQIYGALCIDELQSIFSRLSIVISDEKLRNYLLCAEFSGWLLREKRGYRTLYISLTSKRAMSYKVKNEYMPHDRDRYLADIREYWRLRDPDRFAAIQSNMELTND